MHSMGRLQGYQAVSPTEPSGERATPWIIVVTDDAAVVVRGSHETTQVSGMPPASVPTRDGDCSIRRKFLMNFGSTPLCGTHYSIATWGL